MNIKLMDWVSRPVTKQSHHKISWYWMQLWRANGSYFITGTGCPCYSVETAKEALQVFTIAVYLYERYEP